MSGARWTLERLIRGTALLCLLGFAASAKAGSGPVDVVVTIKPIHSLVSQVMQGVAEPTLLVNGAASPHSFSLKPSQIRAIEKAGVFIRVSERLEPFTGKIVPSLPDSVRLVTLAEAPGVRLLSRRSTGSFEHDQHSHDAAAHEASGADGDTHIWLAPANAKAIGRHIGGVLAERYPEYAARFTANAERLAMEIDALTSELGSETAPLRQRPFIVFHDAYQYFDDSFGLDAVGSITVSPDVQPSAKRLKELRQKIRTLGAVCVFAEPWFQPRLVAALTEGTQARSGTLDPEGASLTPGPSLYFTLMRNLAAGLKACLAPAT